MKGSINYQVSQVMKMLTGHGISKYETRKNSNIKGENNHQVSNLVHSNNYDKAIKNTALSLAQFAKENNIKDMEKINNETIEKYINEKIKKGITNKSISASLSHLMKIRNALNQTFYSRTAKENKLLFSKDKIKELREKANLIAKKTDKSKIKSYSNPNIFLSKIAKRSSLQVELMMKSGIRVNDAIFIKKEQLLTHNQIRFKSKGGKVFIKEIEPVLYEKIKKAVLNNSYNIAYKTFYRDMQKVAKENQIPWSGTHGLRHSWAKKDYSDNLKNGLSNEKSLLKTSQEMAHNRGEITKLYIQSR
jgi:integrase